MLPRVSGEKRWRSWEKLLKTAKNLFPPDISFERNLVRTRLLTKFQCELVRISLDISFEHKVRSNDISNDITVAYTGNSLAVRSNDIFIRTTISFERLYRTKK